MLMNNGPSTDWYINLNKAPWTPPGWLFGVAWTTVMVCFSIYLAYLVAYIKLKLFWLIFILELVLNVSWNFIFFNQQFIMFALVILILLLIVTLFYFINFKMLKLKKIRFLMIPYITWLCIATSLNTYIFLYN